MAEAFGGHMFGGAGSYSDIGNAQADHLYGNAGNDVLLGTPANEPRFKRAA